MPWIRFIANFDFRPPEKQNVCVAYKKGMTQFVRQVCASAAITAGKAIAAKRPDAEPERGNLDDIEGRLT